MEATQVEPKACPQCGKAPRIMPTLFGTYYIVCFGHCETIGCSTKDEAIALWNRDEYEPESPRPQRSFLVVPAQMHAPHRHR